jgi:hypothetical protein
MEIKILNCVVQFEKTDQPGNYYATAFTELENISGRHINRIEVEFVIRNAKGQPLEKDEGVVESIGPGDSVVIRNSCRLVGAPPPTSLKASVFVREWLCRVTRVQNIDILNPEAQDEIPY